ncbi:MAG TPA: hypothetical protein PKW90_15970, partial [Myxococcota bacterium]|nr:hypothetical protein [Myxococcota bacterium]
RRDPSVASLPRTIREDYALHLPRPEGVPEDAGVILQGFSIDTGSRADRGICLAAMDLGVDRAPGEVVLRAMLVGGLCNDFDFRGPDLRHGRTTDVEGGVEVVLYYALVWGVPTRSWSVSIEDREVPAPAERPRNGPREMDDEASRAHLHCARIRDGVELLPRAEPSPPMDWLDVATELRGDVGTAPASLHGFAFAFDPVGFAENPGQPRTDADVLRRNQYVYRYLVRAFSGPDGAFVEGGFTHGIHRRGPMKDSAPPHGAVPAHRSDRHRCPGRRGLGHAAGGLRSQPAPGRRLHPLGSHPTRRSVDLLPGLLMYLLLPALVGWEPPKLVFTPSLELRSRLSSTLERGSVAQRARLGLEARRLGVGGKVALQVVRGWVQAPGTVEVEGSYIPQLAEGWVAWEGQLSDNIELQATVGRQALSVHEGRILGEDDFSMEAQFFDALRLQLELAPLHLEYLNARRFGEPGGNPLGIGVNLLRVGAGADQPTLLWLADVLWVVDGRQSSTLSSTLGFYGNVEVRRLRARVEGYVQRRADLPAARLFAAQGGWVFGENERLVLSTGLEVASG